MPFGDEILFIDTASVDCCSQFLFFQSMIVHDLDVLFNFNFGQLASTFHMHVNGQVFIQIEEKPQSKYSQQCRHSFFFLQM